MEAAVRAAADASNRSMHGCPSASRGLVRHTRQRVLTAELRHARNRNHRRQRGLQRNQQGDKQDEETPHWMIFLLRSSDRLIEDKFIRLPGAVVRCRLCVTVI